MLSVQRIQESLWAQLHYQYKYMCLVMQELCQQGGSADRAADRPANKKAVIGSTTANGLRRYAN
jgi:hypothetical protein